MTRILLLGVALLLTACDTSPRPVEEGGDRTVADVVSGANDFGLRLLAAQAAEQQQVNLALSPLSLTLAMGMALQGAEGETRAELMRTLGLEGDHEAVGEGYRGLLQALDSDDPAVRFHIANSLWYREDAPFAIDSRYLADNERYLHATVKRADFNDPATVDTINQWVAQRTNGLIDELLSPPLSPEDMLLLINALYFKGEWSDPFPGDQTRKASFQRADGETVTVDMMSRRSRIPHAEHEGLELVELRYGEGRYAMSLILPPGDRAISDWLKNLDNARVERLHERLEERDLQLQLPRFTVNFRAEQLGTALRQLGIRQAFDPRRADFSRISPDPDDLHVSAVVHRALVRVDEAGTEAAAATGITVGVTSLPRTLRFDRPFLFLLRERNSGAILFSGVVRDPTAE